MRIICKSLFVFFILLPQLFVHAQGIISTVAGGIIGDGQQAITIGLAEIKNIVTDSSENIYFLDYNNRRVRKITAATGIISTIAKSSQVVFSDDVVAVRCHRASISRFVLRRPGPRAAHR